MVGFEFVVDLGVQWTTNGCSPHIILHQVGGAADVSATPGLLAQSSRITNQTPTSIPTTQPAPTPISLCSPSHSATMTSTIGIPIKLLNESTVSEIANAFKACLVLTGPVAADSRCYRATKSRLKSPLDRHTAESSSKVRSRKKGNATREESKANATDSRGQHERTNGEHQRHTARRQSHTPGSRIHPWLARAPVHCA
jgi:hypothetical protein